jgi:enoyl-CoA hydratase
VGSEHVLAEQIDGVTVLRLRRPPANAIDLAFAREIEASLGRLETDRHTRAVVLTGTDRFFSAGLDLKSVPRLDADEQREMILAFGRMVARLYAFPKPTVAAVNGHAVAGGLLLTLSCDYRVGPEQQCEFGLTGARAGIPYPVSAMEVIRAELSPAAARTMVLTGRTFEPQEALVLGVLDDLVEPASVLSMACEVAQGLAHLPQYVYATTKNDLRKDALAAIREALETGTDPMMDSWLTPETQSASARALDRRD